MLTYEMWLAAMHYFQPFAARAPARDAAAEARPLKTVPARLHIARAYRLVAQRAGRFVALMAHRIGALAKGRRSHGGDTRRDLCQPTSIAGYVHRAPLRRVRPKGLD